MDYKIQWTDQRQEVEDDSTDLTILENREERSWFGPGGWSSSAPMNWWQFGADLQGPSAERATAVYACRKVLAEEVSRLRCYHYKIDEDGGKTRLGSRLSRILRYPNDWQSRVDFWLNMIDSLLRDGNAYALAGYDDTGAKSSLTQLRTAHPYVDYETGMLFYGVGVDSARPLPEIEDIEPNRLVPARYVLHLRLFTPANPLMGESPLVAAAVAANTGTAISNSSFSFFNRAARPSGYLRHPGKIKQAGRERLRDHWARNYSGEGTGGTAVLEEGMEWHPLTMTAVDAEIVDQYKLQVEDIARVFRVPLFMLGDLSKATFTNVESLTRSFIAGGLGFYIALIEAALGRFFDLPADEIVEFDVEGGLLRAEAKDRIDAGVRGIQGGLYTPNEARRREGLPGVENGDQPLVQQQMVPLDYAVSQSVDGSSDEPVTDDAGEDEMPDEDQTRAIVRTLYKVA